NRDLQHGQAVERHPCCTVCLVQVPSRGQRRAAIEDTDVVESEKAARKDVASLGVFAVDPPVEVQHQSLEGSLQKLQVGAAKFYLNSVEEQGGPGVDWGIHVAKVPLVCGNLPVGMGVQVSEHEQELLFGEVEVHQRERDGVESQVPCRI